MYFVYVLKSINFNWHYIGHTSDLTKRLEQHNKGYVKSTKNRRPYKLIFQEKFDEKSSAYKKEMYYKSAEGNIHLRKRLIDQGLW